MYYLRKPVSGSGKTLPRFAVAVAVFLLVFVKVDRVSALRASPGEPEIRVLLLEQARDVWVSSVEDLVMGLPGSKRKKELQEKSIHIQAGKKNLVLSSPGWKNQKKILISSPKNILRINQKYYRGTLEIIYTGRNRLQVINHVPVEDYLKGVIPNEIYTGWLSAIIRAQVIVARTYTIIEIKKHRKDIFDVFQTTRSQVYRGFMSENARTNREIEASRGKILTYNSEPIAVFYHSACGGWTEKSEAVWPGKKSAPYEENIRDPFCMEVPELYWETFVSTKELENILREKNEDFRGKIRKVEYGMISPTGRVKTIRVYTEKDTWEIRTNDLRMVIGPTRIRSTLFTITKFPKGVQFRGRGRGHGVGLCQWGGKVMAEKGFSTREILHFYFPNTSVKSRW